MHKFAFSTILTFFLVINPFITICQDLTGVWIGELIQVPDKSFYFEIRIDTVYANGKIEGTTYVEKDGDFGTIAFNGKVSGNKISFRETEIIKEYRSSNAFYWFPCS